MFMKMKPVAPPIGDLRMIIGDPLMDSLHRRLHWSVKEEIEVSKRKPRVGVPFLATEPSYKR